MGSQLELCHTRKFSYLHKVDPSDLNDSFHLCKPFNCLKLRWYKKGIIPSGLRNCKKFRKLKEWKNISPYLYFQFFGVCVCVLVLKLNIFQTTKVSFLYLIYILSCRLLVQIEYKTDTSSFFCNLYAW